MTATTEPTWTGIVRHLHKTPRAFLPMESFPELSLVEGRGIVGDRYMIGQETGFYSHKPEEGRQITLFEIETLEALARRTYSQMWDISEETHRELMTETRHFARQMFRQSEAADGEIGAAFAGIRGFRWIEVAVEDVFRILFQFEQQFAVSDARRLIFAGRGLGEVAENFVSLLRPAQGRQRAGQLKIEPIIIRRTTSLDQTPGQRFFVFSGRHQCLDFQSGEARPVGFFRIAALDDGEGFFVFPLEDQRFRILKERIDLRLREHA